MAQRGIAESTAGRAFGEAPSIVLRGMMKNAANAPITVSAQRMKNITESADVSKYPIDESKEKRYESVPKITQRAISESDA